MIDSKELFYRLKRELDKRRKKHERKEEDEMSMVDDSSSTSSVEASSPDINKSQRQSSAAAAGGKKARRGSSRSSRKITIESESSPLSLSLYSSMQLPSACLNEHDGCDEAELVARAYRCKEILRLSKEAKEAEEAAKNKKSLIWAKATFEQDPATTEVRSGK